MTEADIRESNRKRGLCPSLSCGKRCFLQRIFGGSPITDLASGVVAGFCLHCQPDKRFLREYWETIEAGDWSRALSASRDRREEIRQCGSQLICAVLSMAYEEGADVNFLDAMLELIPATSSLETRRSLRSAFRPGVPLSHMKRIMVLRAPLKEAYPGLNWKRNFDGNTNEMPAINDLLGRGLGFWVEEAKRRKKVTDTIYAAFPSEAQECFERWYFSCLPEGNDDTANALLGRFLSSFPMYLECTPSVGEETDYGGSSNCCCLLHRAIAAGVRWGDGLQAIYDATPYSHLTAADPNTKLRHFQMAAIRGDDFLDECYTLLRRSPDLIQTFPEI
eukprot:CAMPEP_0197434094 /NCGR_PEP_ID=MMETSP1175-20131217/1858_1 /TAXON_ID=1003142 /ORGANISM="Triceratium dubium, Strain CCMP147" /LENGTH=333 /DNA_ID=CAMNT_0042962685 /DNA_START=215 /DNA_END=1216 /DNA_ORIENTATION=+